MNNELQHEVQEALEWEPTVDEQNITVKAEDGAVTLTGHVATYYAKTRAVDAVEHVYGVKVVADELEVHLHEAHARSDADIARSIAHVLEWNSALAAQNIQAKVDDGRVTLTGEVSWQYERVEAEQAVERVLGVRFVSNRITVKPGVAAAQVEKRIVDALARHAALDARLIHVTTSGSKAVLTGHVHSLEEERIARQAAWAAPGISEVDDLLVVQP